MERLTLMWIFAALLTALVFLMACEFIRGWKQGRSAAKKISKEGHNFTQKAKVPQNAKYELSAGAVQEVSKLDTSSFDFMGRPRPAFRLTLPPDGLCLHIFAPTKAIADRFVALGELLTKSKHSADDVEELLAVSAEIFSNNKERIQVIPEFIAKRCSAEDVVAVLQCYLGWLHNQVSQKN